MATTTSSKRPARVGALFGLLAAATALGVGELVAAARVRAQRRNWPSAAS